MKVNFWQILGIALLVIGAAGYVYEHYFAAAPAPAVPAIVQPATAPTTAAAL